jgi:hypothetical protein
MLFDLQYEARRKAVIFVMSVFTAGQCIDHSRSAYSKFIYQHGYKMKNGKCFVSCGTASAGLNMFLFHETNTNIITSAVKQIETCAIESFTRGGGRGFKKGVLV